MERSIAPACSGLRAEAGVANVRGRSRGPAAQRALLDAVVDTLVKAERLGSVCSNIPTVAGKARKQRNAVVPLACGPSPQTYRMHCCSFLLRHFLEVQCDECRRQSATNQPLQHRRLRPPMDMKQDQGLQGARLHTRFGLVLMRRLGNHLQRPCFPLPVAEPLGSMASRQAIESNPKFRQEIARIQKEVWPNMPSHQGLSQRLRTPTAQPDPEGVNLQHAGLSLGPDSVRAESGRVK
jgi:hypothetical protein